MSDRNKNDSRSVLLSLGSNIKPEENILSALGILATIHPLIQISTIWESASVGSSGPNYLNCAALINTHLSIEVYKKNVISPIEDRLGRIRSSDKYIDRTIDVDILIYDGSVIDPEIWTQAHLAVPASELFPDFKNPISEETLAKTAERFLENTEIVQRLDLQM